MLLRLILFIFVVLFSCIFYPVYKPSVLTGEVLQVQDGDSILFKSAGKILKVRLAHMDAPESDQLPVGELSTKMLIMLIDKHHPQQLEVLGIDIYGRTLAVLRAGKISINYEMVRLGGAIIYDYSRFSSSTEKWQYLRAFDQARREIRGIYKWEFLKPSVHRKLKKSPLKN